VSLRLLLVLLLAPCPAAAATPHDSGREGVSETLLRAMRDEMKRTVSQLRLEGLEKPYFVSQTVRERSQVDLEGTFGALRRPRVFRARSLKVELRVGAPEFDDTHYVGNDVRGFRPMVASLPLEDDYDALRFEIWSLTDRAYKQALERFAHKTAYKQARNIVEEIRDLSEDPVQSFRETAMAAGFDRALWENRLRKVSEVFRRFPAIQTSGARLWWSAEHLYFVDSQGRSFVKPTHLYEIRLSAKAQAEDGMTQSDERRIVGNAADELPSLESLVAEAEQLAADVTALARAPQAATYLGPVLLEAQAAGEFFNQLLASGVSNPRSLWIEQQWAEQYFESGSLAGRLGLRVVSPMIDVFDDPTLREWDGQRMIGHYGVDDEGIPGRRVQLVQRGILKDLLMSRTPTRERKLSNGHGRSDFKEHLTSRIGNLVISASETMSAKALRRRLREEARAFGLQHGLLVRRIAPEDGQDNDELLAHPVLVYSVDVDTGDEHLLRDAQFTAVTLRALRDIIAASEQQRVHNFRKLGSVRGSRSYVPATIVHPAVLLTEMELKPTDRKPDKRPYLKHPFFDRASPP